MLMFNEPKGWKTPGYRGDVATFPFVKNNEYLCENQ